ncbi:MAG: DUF3445 domain-containing protein [Acidobacteria bacterium]|nr:DUF3445 domain-containing protein [Acidobacteriota bacterium]
MAGARPRHLPFTGDGSRLRMGLRPLDLGDWLEVDEDLGAFLDHKAHVLETRPGDVVAVVDDPDGRVRRAGQELLDVLVQHLAECHATTHRRLGDAVVVDGGPEPVPVTPAALDRAGIHPVDAAGRLVAEDWAVQLRRSEGWTLDAASICSPTRWVLAEKLGRPMAAVHEPVAGYAEQLAAPVDRFFDRLEVDAPRWRLNWNLSDDDSLYQPTGKYRTEPADDLSAADVPDRIWLRVERQTLRRLPSTGAVVFGIRVHQDLLGRLAGRPEVLARLAGTIRSFPPGTLEHKSMGAFAPAVLEWIDRM